MFKKWLALLLAVGAVTTVSVTSIGLAAADGQTVEYTEVPCAHGWAHGTDLMQGDTLIGCHGYDTTTGYTAMPCYDLCECGGKRTGSTVWSGVWRDYREVTCTHYPHGTDVIQRMAGIITIKCSSCGDGSDSITYKYNTRCGGYRT